MIEEELTIRDDFPSVGYDAWKARAVADLKRAPFEKRLVGRTVDDIALEPICTAGDWPSAGDPSGFPGSPPFTRGMAALAREPGGWDVRQEVTEPEPAAANAVALVEVEQGAVDASFIGCFTPQKSGRRHAKFCVLRDGISGELVAPDNVLASLGEMRLGDAVTLKLLEDGARQRVLVCERRAEGHPFDQLERLPGIVDHQNHDKHLASVYVNPDRTVLVHYTDVPTAEEIPPGRWVEVRIARHDERINSYSVAEAPVGESDNIRVHAGPIRLNPKGFGFVGDDIFVPQQLAANLADGTLVNVVAKRERKRDRPSELQWRAVAVGASE